MKVFQLILVLFCLPLMAQEVGPAHLPLVRSYRGHVESERVVIYCYAGQSTHNIAVVKTKGDKPLRLDTYALAVDIYRTASGYEIWGIQEGDDAPSLMMGCPTMSVTK